MLERKGSMGIRLTDFGHGRVDAPRLDPREIIIRDNWNYREMDNAAVKAHIAFLKDSIREIGVQEPISVELVDGKIYLVDGECRLRALKELWDEEKEVFVLAIQAKGDEADILAKSMIANGSLPPTVIEFGNAAKRLAAFGWTVEQIAALTPPHLGLQGAKAKRFVKTALELQAAPDEVKEAVAHGVEGVEVSPALAVQAVRKSREKAHEIVTEAVREAKAEGKTVAKREKKPGKAAKQREAATEHDQALYDAGDKMAGLILADGTEWTTVVRAAKTWQKLRG
jgi:ParB-like chromosome segregation protein Spo0J